MPYIELSYWQVALAAALILINAGVSLALQLGLERTLFIASVRTIGQLWLIGIVLQWAFEVDSAPVVVLLMVAMTLIAGLSAVRRVDRRFKGVWTDSILSVWASSWLITFYVLVVIINVRPWYTPQYAIPLLGMILGNTLSGISLGLGRFTDELITNRAQVETLLALGATRWEAARRPIREAVRTGMIPMINSMMVVGLVSLPGMMTGQLLTGTAPIHAVQYQIVILFSIAAGTALGTVGVVLLSYRRLFSPHHQFRSAAIRTPKGGH